MKLKAILCLLPAVAVAQTNFIDNGDFETVTGATCSSCKVAASTIAPWTSSDGFIFLNAAAQSSSGSYGVRLNHDGPYTLSQVVDGLTVGVAYTLAFDMRSGSGGFVKSMNVAATGNAAADFHAATADGSWSRQEYNFIATSASTTISFQSTMPSNSGGDGLFLDKITLTQASSSLFNGGFESSVPASCAPPTTWCVVTAPSPWKTNLTNNAMEIQSTAQTWNPYAGTYHADLNTAEPYALTQTANLVVGRRYTLSFMTNGNGGTNTKTMRVSATGSSPLSISIPAGQGWTLRTYSFTATEVFTDITFESTTAGTTGPLIDSVMLTVSRIPTRNAHYTKAINAFKGTWTGSQHTGNDCLNNMFGHRHATIAPVSLPWNGITTSVRYIIFGAKKSTVSWDTSDFINPANACSNTEGADFDGFITGGECGGVLGAEEFFTRVADTTSGCPSSTTKTIINQTAMANALEHYIHRKMDKQRRGRTVIPDVIQVAGLIRGSVQTRLRDLLHQAAQNGIYIIVPAGDEGGNSCLHQINTLDTVLVVGAHTDFYGAISGNRGECVDVYAHGFDRFARSQSSFYEGSIKAAAYAAMHVAHLVDSAFGRSMPPKDLYAFIKRTAVNRMIATDPEARVLTYSVPLVDSHASTDGLMTLTSLPNIRAEADARRSIKPYYSAPIDDVLPWGGTFNSNYRTTPDDTKCSGYRAALADAGFTFTGALKSKARLVYVGGNVREFDYSASEATRSRLSYFDAVDLSSSAADGIDTDIHNMLVNPDAAAGCSILGGTDADATRRLFIRVGTSMSRLEFAKAMQRIIEERIRDTTPVVAVFGTSIDFAVDDRLRCLIQEAVNVGVFLIFQSSPPSAGNALFANQGVFLVGHSTNINPGHANYNLYAPGMSNSNRFAAVTVAIQALNVIANNVLRDYSPVNMARYLMATATTYANGTRAMTTTLNANANYLNQAFPASKTWLNTCHLQPAPVSHLVTGYASTSTPRDTQAHPANTLAGLSFTTLASGVPEKCQPLMNGHAQHINASSSGSFDSFPFTTINNNIALFIIDSGVISPISTAGYYDNSGEGTRDYVYHGHIMQKVLLDSQCGAISRANMGFDTKAFRMRHYKAFDKERKTGVWEVHDAIKDIIATVDDFRATTPNFQAVVHLAGIFYGITNEIDCLIDFAATQKNIHFVVAAGNTGENACNFSPARLSNVLTVGAIATNGSFSSSSNVGSCVDILANGFLNYEWTALQSSVYGKSTDSGTSLSTAFATAAYVNVLAKSSTVLTPAQARFALLNAARSIATGVPTGTTRRILTYTNGPFNTASVTRSKQVGTSCPANVLNSPTSTLSGSLVTDEQNPGDVDPVQPVICPTNGDPCSDGSVPFTP